MRADRLLSILLLLQSRGKLTAEKLANELEVSIRTIYRDIDALCMAGFPLYAEKGKGGGYALLEDFDLPFEGLNTRDIQALAALEIPKSLDEIGLGTAMRTALLKILERLDHQTDGESSWLQKRLLLDSTYPFKPQKSTANLQLIQKAVWGNQLIRFSIQYPAHFGRSKPLTAAPLTLIAAGDRWFLIAARKDFLRIYRLSSLREVSLLEETFSRPRHYDPKTFWRHWKSLNETKQNFEVLVLVHKDLVPSLPWIKDPDPQTAAPRPQKAGWQVVQMAFENLNQARTELLGLGASVIVLAPEALRLSIIDYAKLTLENYA